MGINYFYAGEFLSNDSLNFCKKISKSGEINTSVDIVGALDRDAHIMSLQAAIGKSSTISRTDEKRSSGFFAIIRSMSG